MTQTPPGPVFRRIGGRIGAEVRGIDLTQPLSGPAVDAILAAVLTHKLLIFRDQHGLTDALQEQFVSAFGTPVHHPTSGKEIIGKVDGRNAYARANVWHSDATFVSSFPKFASLRPVELPEAGGDTIWGNAAAAYADLPAPLRALADTLWGLHTNDYEIARNVSRREEALDPYAKVYASTVYETEHPVVQIIPETGERALLLGNFIHRFADLPRGESQQLHAVLQGYVTRPENSLRWRWSKGDFAFYDNRTTQHYGVNDYGHAPRIMHTARTEGEPPASINGRQSRTRIVRSADDARRAA